MYEPRVMDVPGFDTPLKEASLEEFMSALPIDHMAQKQLSDLRRLAMDGAKATSELLEALNKIRELEADRQRLDAKFDELHTQWAKEVNELLLRAGDAEAKVAVLTNQAIPNPEWVAAEGCNETPSLRSMTTSTKVWDEFDKVASEVAVANAKVINEKATEPVKPEGVFVKAMAGKLPCPHCSKLISTLPGPWARHMNFAHPQLLDPNSTPATLDPQ